MKFTRRELLESVAVAAILIGSGYRSEAWPVHGSAGAPPVPTTPYINEVTTETPDIICVEVLDPIVQRGLCQFSGSSFPGTDQTWTTANNPLTGTLNDSCVPLGNPGMLYTRRFTDNPPSTYYNRNASDVVGDWSISGGLTITEVCRKSYPYCEGSPSYGTTASGHTATSSRHYVWLKLSGALSSGTTYTITMPAGTNLGPLTFAFNDKVTRARSLRVNQAGHRAIDDLKLGYLASLVYGYGTEGQVEFTSTYGINSFNVIDKNGSVAYSGGTFSQRVTPTTVELQDSNGGYNRFYQSAQQRPGAILGMTFANPGVFTTNIPMSNGQVVRLLGLGKGLAVTNAVWSSANGGQIVYTVTNNQGAGTYSVGNYATFSGFSPSGFNGTFQVFAATTTTVTVLASNPGAYSVLGSMSNPASFQISPASGNTSNYYIVANATTSPNTCTLKQMLLPSGASGSDVSTIGLGPWGPGTFLTPTICTALGADPNGGYGFDSLMVPCYQANRAATYVYGLDYSAATIMDLPSSGSPYRLQIPGLGVSDPITIDEGTWYNNAWASAKGLYHQTSGPAIDGRFGYSRPAALTNGLNGTALYWGTLPMGFTTEGGGYSGLNNIVQGMNALAPFITSNVGPSNLGGGYHDAGDWTSVCYSHCLELWQLLDLGLEYCGGTTPSIAAAQTTTFNFPRMSQTWGATYAGTDSLPDAIHMAVYLGEYYRQTQDTYGAVASGTSFGSTNFGDGGPSEFVPSNASSYSFSLNAPDHVANYSFALLAAKIAIIFYNNGFSTLATMWQTAAVNAFTWSEGIWSGLQSDPLFYYITTAYNGTALNIPAKTITGNLVRGAVCPVHTYSSTGITTNGVGTLGTIISSSDFINGTYTDIPLTGGSGTDAVATIVVAANKVSQVIPSQPGNNFIIGDSLSCSLGSIGSGSSFSVPVATVTQTNSMATALGVVGQVGFPLGAIVGGSGGTPGTYSNVALTTSGNGSGATANITVGVSGGVTAVTIVDKGANFVYLDTLSAISGDIGGCTGFSVPVHYCTPSPSNTLGYNAWIARASAAGALFRMQGVFGAPQTTYGNAFLQTGLGVSASNAGCWEAWNAANNTSQLAMLSAANFPANWTNGTGNTCTHSEDSTNSYYSVNGGIGTNTQIYNLCYGYIISVRASGTSSSLAIRTRKCLAAQLSIVLGANQTGLSLTTGLGARNTLGILHRDWQAVAQAIGGLQPPPIGLTPYGWPGTTFPTGQSNFNTDNVNTFTVVYPTGIWESTYGSKRIVKPNNQSIVMWDATTENSYCITTMEFSGPGQIISQLVAALWLWCWDGNTSKT